MKSCIVMQSGGPTSVINASLYGIITEAMKDKDVKLLGSLNGIKGLINDNIISIEQIENVELLINTPGAILGSARHQLDSSYDNDEYKKILNTLEKHNCKYLLLIGGNDSMDTVSKLAAFFKINNVDINILGVPKTIDNDMVNIDHTPGYGSAIKYLATTINEIKLDTSVYRSGRVTICEVMGRDSGWLAAGTKLASLNGLGPDLIYLPEVSFEIDKFLEDVKKIYDKQKKVLVVISEGIRNKNGEYILNEYLYQSNNDVFGHQQLGGTATVLANIVKQKLNLSVRSIEFNLMQRSSNHLASKQDIDEAINYGKLAHQYVHDNTGKMITSTRIKEYELEYSLIDVNEIANQIKYFPIEWIKNENDISDDFITYAKPLIDGNVTNTYENGLIKYAKLK